MPCVVHKGMLKRQAEILVCTEEYSFGGEARKLKTQTSGGMADTWEEDRVYPSKETSK